MHPWLGQCSPMAGGSRSRLSEVEHTPWYPPHLSAGTKSSPSVSGQVSWQLPPIPILVPAEAMSPFPLHAGTPLCHPPAPDATSLEVFSPFPPSAGSWLLVPTERVWQPDGDGSPCCDNVPVTLQDDAGAAGGFCLPKPHEKANSLHLSWQCPSPWKRSTKLEDKYWRAPRQFQGTLGGTVAGSALLSFALLWHEAAPASSAEVVQRFPGSRQQGRGLSAPPHSRPSWPSPALPAAGPAWLSLQLQESCTAAPLQLLLLLHFPGSCILLSFCGTSPCPQPPPSDPYTFCFVLSPALPP